MEIIDGNPDETGCDHARFTDSPLRDYLDHIDTMLHDLARQLDELHGTVMPHRPLLERAAAMMDPGAKLRDMLLPGKKRTPSGKTIT